MASTAATVAMDTELLLSGGWGQRWGRGAFGEGEYRDKIAEMVGYRQCQQGAGEKGWSGGRRHLANPGPHASHRW